jgi:hypothetical protein
VCAALKRRSACWGQRMLQRVYSLQTTRCSQNFAKKDDFSQAGFRCEQSGDIHLEICLFGNPESFRRCLGFDRHRDNRRLLKLNG